MSEMKKEELLEPILESKSEITMDAIRMHRGTFTDGSSLDKLLEVFQLDIQDTTAKNNMLRVGSKQYCFNGSTLFHYDIYVEEKQVTNVVKNDIGLLLDNQNWVAIKPIMEGHKCAKVDLKEFVNELIGSVDGLTLEPKHIKSRRMLKKFSNLVKRTLSREWYF